MTNLNHLGALQHEQQPRGLADTAPYYCSLQEREPVRSQSRIAKQTLALVLAGGRGSRLAQLTDWRAKPAVPFGGKLRIIDFALSNCVNSGIRRIGILTQYKAQSLIRHVQRGWSFLDGRFDEFVELLPAQQRVEPTNWYAGTADAVYQNLDILRRHAPEYVLILAGDHVYKMDYARMLAEHAERRADMSVACVEVPRARASDFGVVEVDRFQRILQFHEKPADPVGVPGRPEHALASMGVYVVNAQFLYDHLTRDARAPGSGHDFGRDIIPRIVETDAAVYAHDFALSCVNTGGKPYWRDVGTVDAYWEANMELTKVVPELNLYDVNWPIWTLASQLPPAKFVFDDPERRGVATESLVSSGCIVSGSTVRRSVLFTNVRVHNFCEIEDSVVLPEVEIGPDVHVRRAVIDKRCRLPGGLRVGYDLAVDRQRFHVTEGGVTLIVPEMLGQKLHSQ